MIKTAQIGEAGLEIILRAAIDIPDDYRSGIRKMCEQEEEELSKFVLLSMLENWDAAEKDRRAMCADTGLPRYFVKVANEARIEGGFVALERAIRWATAKATREVPLRPNRVHPLTRKDNNNNVGIGAPEIEYSFEPDGDWVDITTVHKGGLFGTDYRMLFPGDGIDGIKRFFLDVMLEFGRRGLRSEEHTSELQSLMRNSYAVFCLKKKKYNNIKKQ